VAVSSPIVWGDHVFVTTAVSSDTSASLRTGLYGDVEPAKDTSKHSWEVYALDRRSGKVLWKRVAHEGLPKTKRHPKSSQASPTPVTDGKVVVAHFGSEGLYAYDWGVASSPILFRDMVIIQADIQKDSFVAAYRLKDGRQVWKTMRDEIPSWGTPAIYEDKQRPELITHATKFIRGYDPLTGRELWRLSGNSEITTPTPLIAHGLIYVTNGYRGIQPIYAIRPGASGDITLPKGEESSEFIAWSKPRGGPYTPTPLIYGDLMYILSNNGVLAAYNAKTGERLYQERVGKGGSYSASPVAANGRLYLTSEDGEINVVKTGPKFELIGENSVGEVTMATPAIAGDLMIIRGLKHVIAIGGTPRASR
jgi:outer membrane protein assembly factor BamB